MLLSDFDMAKIKEQFMPGKPGPQVVGEEERQILSKADVTALLKYVAHPHRIPTDLNCAQH